MGLILLQQRYWRRWRGGAGAVHSLCGSPAAGTSAAAVVHLNGAPCQARSVPAHAPQAGADVYSKRTPPGPAGQTARSSAVDTIVLKDVMLLPATPIVLESAIRQPTGLKHPGGCRVSLKACFDMAAKLASSTRAASVFASTGPAWRHQTMCTQGLWASVEDPLELRNRAARAPYASGGKRALRWARLEPHGARTCLHASLSALSEVAAAER